MERRRLLEELRARYLDGTIDEILIPDDADVTELLAELEKQSNDDEKGELPN